MFLKYTKNIAQWPIYLTLDNLSYKIWRLKIKSKEIIISFISIYKNDLISIKIKIYY